MLAFANPQTPTRSWCLARLGDVPGLDDGASIQVPRAALVPAGSSAEEVASIVSALVASLHPQSRWEALRAQVDDGFEVLGAIEACGTRDGKPSAKVVIEDCGEL